jgi:hypothetical protein
MTLHEIIQRSADYLESELEEMDDFNIHFIMSQYVYNNTKIKKNQQHEDKNTKIKRSI